MKINIKFDKDMKFALCFALIFLINALALYTHNRLNAFLYLLLLGIYLFLYCPPKHFVQSLRKLFFDFEVKQAVLSWVFCVFAPIFLALYYLNFKLLLLNFLLVALLSGGAWYLKNKE